MIYWIAIIFGGLIIIYLSLKNDQSSNEYFNEINQTILVSTMDEDRQAVNLTSLSDESFIQKLKRASNNTYNQLGDYPAVKLLIYFTLLLLFSFYINQNFIRENIFVVAFIIEIVGILWGISWLQKRERKKFEESFPDALNILTSAISSGESIIHAIVFVGKTLDGAVGNEFSLMGERLQLGESPDNVFRKSCMRFPYPSFQFFVITLRANMHRGGQLKDVMSRLNRIMFDARAIEKKKYALTSEARISAKIVAAIPFIFLFMLQYLSPENYEFVMFNPGGRPILYYVIISESIGITIVWLLMKGVR
ncbi:type II secretion system F family protein [Photobacterium damselae]|uniref:Flp pilus assembly protein TadB n=3 Tax=Photobacterium damselae TaxID=38293 RepID=D0Z550_PHODD|nr:type II secretion system F family protein [Photobacterium damselae]EEZ39084.1 flp pilus assembly protein TadB [Photobacterium damselae subsp. damselae CIP 102761]KAB1175006.1 pilus assembly protein TadB [Photobacterium damselae subsp. damselae]KAB1180256.1 pilus assembly protein TadB [Photobacterium damselae subsp. damselae]MBF7100770.1 pilus assembly protein TadB [Photobacterium damselae]NVO73632.1 type II secretion system F family protein [Photobacterium damselae subsp. damselae]